MRIGIFDPYLDTLGGGEKYILTAVSALSKNNEVDIFWDPKDAAEIKQIVKRKFDLDLTRVQFTPNIFSKKTSFISRFLSTRRFDLIIFLSDGSIPFVGTRLFIHFQFPVEWIGKTFLTSLKIRRSEKIICNSFFTKSFIDKKLNINSIVLYPPADIRSKINAKKENVILHVGRFGYDIEGSNYKKQDVMIDVFKKIVDSGIKDWRFIIVVSVKKEDEEKLEKLKERAAEYPIEFLENISNNTLLETYAKAKIYWHASGFGEDLTKNPERAEHFGIATVEAMANGAVPIVIDAGGQREIVEDGKSGMLWNTIDEFIRKTKIILENEYLRGKIAIAAKKRAKIFSKEEFCKKLEELL